MKDININQRLTTALSFVDKCKCMADIGSDHGYSSIYAINHGIAEHVIATDISKPSLAKTQNLVEKYGLADRIECRVGDGLKVLLPGETNVAFIAGMGAELIADIVEASADVAQRLDYMVLQPMNASEPLRRRMVAMGYRIDREGIVIENGKYYQILKCSRGKTEFTSDIEFELGFFVYKEKIPLCAEYILHMIKHYENILNYVGENNTLAAREKTVEAQNKIEEYRKALEWALSE